MERDDLRIGQELSNQEIVDLFSVGNMGGMRRSLSNNLLVLISDHTKGLYDDRWQGEVLLYTGMGKAGDQELKSQNKTVAESHANGIAMHLFEVTVPTRYRYSGVVELADEPFREDQNDETGKPRKVWIFPLRRTQAPSGVFEDIEPKLEAAGEFNPHNVIDAREKVLASIVRRRGQRVFRNSLLSAYEGRCALTGCKVVELLEAAHIVPYQGGETNAVQNGLLLRTDLHTLFDLGMIAIDTSTWKVVVSKRLLKSKYRGLQDIKVRLPKESERHPNREALDLHRQTAGL
jgi:5-methylcytosine-specific restriction protein A